MRWIGNQRIAMRLNARIAVESRPLNGRPQQGTVSPVSHCNGRLSRAGQNIASIASHNLAVSTTATQSIASNELESSALQSRESHRSARKGTHGRAGQVTGFQWRAAHCNAFQRQHTNPWHDMAEPGRAPHSMAAPAYQSTAKPSREMQRTAAPADHGSAKQPTVVQWNAGPEMQSNCGQWGEVHSTVTPEKHWTAS